MVLFTAGESYQSLVKPIAVMYIASNVKRTTAKFIQLVTYRESAVTAAINTIVLIG